MRHSSAEMRLFPILRNKKLIHKLSVDMYVANQQIKALFNLFKPQGFLRNAAGRKSWLPVFQFLNDFLRFWFYTECVKWYHSLGDKSLFHLGKDNNKKEKMFIYWNMRYQHLETKPLI